MRNDGILLSAVELFTSRHGHSAEEKRVFLELARNFLPSSTLRDRRRVASLLVCHDETPDALLNLVAQDPDMLTAYPALRHSPRLSVDLLEDVARNGPDVLRLAVTSRDSLPDSVIRVLCDHADVATIRLLLKREDLVLGPWIKSRLARRADVVAALEPELIRHDALDSEGLMSHFRYLSPPMRAEAIAAAEMASLVHKAQAENTVGRSVADTARMRLHGALLRAASVQKRDRFAQTLGQGLGLPTSVTAELLDNHETEPFLIALKAIGMDQTTATTIAVRLMGEEVSLEELRDALTLFKNISLGAAETLVSHWTLTPDQPAGQDGARSSRHAPVTIETPARARNGDAAGMEARGPAAVRSRAASKSTAR